MMNFTPTGTPIWVEKLLVQREIAKIDLGQATLAKKPQRLYI